MRVSRRSILGIALEATGVPADQLIGGSTVDWPENARHARRARAEQHRRERESKGKPNANLIDQYRILGPGAHTRTLSTPGETALTPTQSRKKATSGDVAPPSQFVQPPFITTASKMQS